MLVQSKRFFRDLVLATGVVAGVLALLAVISLVQNGRSDTERFVTELAMPFTFFWICLGWLAVWRCFRGRSLARLGSAAEVSEGREQTPVGSGGAPSSSSACHGDGKWLVVVWCALTIIGNGWLAGAAVRAIEYPTDLTWVDGEPFDFVVLLGGGVSSGVDDSPVLNADGDRIRPPLALWASGKTKLLVVTGDDSIEGRPGGGQLTEQMFLSFGVPQSAIVRSSGRNTSEEMKGLREFLDKWSAEHGGAEPRWALVTSAFHMPRALRLAEKQGLFPVPIATASRLDEEPIRWARVVVPSAAAIDNLARCFKEKLAALVGR